MSKPAPVAENEGVIDSALPGRDGKPVRAVTRFKVEKRFSDTTLARVRIETGRMHQIRLHFARLGYPVVLDDQHGDFAFNKRFRKQYGLKRQFLHASSLTLDYGGKKRTWTAPIPEDLAATLRALEGKQGGLKSVSFEFYPGGARAAGRHATPQHRAPGGGKL